MKRVLLIALGVFVGLCGFCTVLVITVGTVAELDNGAPADSSPSLETTAPSVRQPTPTTEVTNPSVRQSTPASNGAAPPVRQTTPTAGNSTPLAQQPTPTSGIPVPSVREPTPEPTTPPTPEPGPILDATDLVERFRDGIVKVEAGWRSSGSGFIFDVDGATAFIATNHHVIEDADSVDVVVRNTRSYEALVLGWDADRDVAVLSICCSNDFLVLDWDRATPGVGDDVVAIGYPRGGQRGQVTATIGVVSENDAISRLYDFIPHTAPLNPGNSGGPLFSMPDAKVIGINTARGTQQLSFYAVPFQAIENQLAEWRSQLVVS